MMKEHIFKAYDIRGVYPRDIDARSVRTICARLGRHFGRGSVVMGHDARLSSPLLYRAAIAGFCDARGAAGIVRGERMTTPMFYFLVNHLRATGGVMVTASHNPQQWNGLKVVGPRAVPVGGREILALIRKSKIKVQN